MNAQDEERIRHLLKQALPPIADTGPEHDLWPSMRRRLEARPAAVPWFDWALVGGLALFVLALPPSIPVLLFYL